MFDGTQGKFSILCACNPMLNDVLKQWYKRRKPDANCNVGDKFMDPVEHEENCQCTDADYEWCLLSIPFFPGLS